MNPTTSINPFEASSPQIAIQHLRKVRTPGTTIMIPKGEQNISKLLLLTPLIHPHNGMKRRDEVTTAMRQRATGDQPPDFDSACLPSSPIGSRTPGDETRIMWSLEQGIILSAKVARDYILDSGEKQMVPPSFQPSQNVLTLTTEDIGKLVNAYVMALNACDSMLILLYAALMQMKQPSRYTEFISLLDKEFRFGNDPIRHILQSIPYTFMNFRDNEDNQCNTDFGLVGRKLPIPWFEQVRNVGSFCIMMPIDHCLIDHDTSSFTLLFNEGKGFKNPQALITYIVATNLPIAVQLYRLGRFMMDARRTEATLYFLKTAEIKKLSRLNVSELVLMGGELMRDTVTALVRELVLVMMGTNNEEEEFPEETQEERWFRCGIIFCFLSASSGAPHCVIDIIARPAEFNVIRYLLSLVNDEKAMNAGLKRPLTDIAFYLVEQLMEQDSTRLHSEAVETFTDFRYLLEVDVSDPLHTRHLNIFQRRYDLASRHYIDSRKQIGEKNLTTTNESNSIVLMSEEEASSDTRRYETSIYLIYNSEGEVIPEERRKDDFSGTGDDFSILESRSLGSLLENQNGGNPVQEVQGIFTERRIQTLKISVFPQEGYTELYIANLEGKALDTFSKRVLQAGQQRNSQLKEAVVKTPDDLFKPQIVNLLQEAPIIKDGKEYYFLHPRQLCMLARATAALQNIGKKERELRLSLEDPNSPHTRQKVKEEIESVQKERTWWTTTILRIPSNFELAGKVAIERAVKEANALRGLYNNPMKNKKTPQAAPTPQPKRSRRGKAQTLEQEDESETSEELDSMPTRRKPQKKRKGRDEVLTERQEKLGAAQAAAETNKVIVPEVREDIDTRLLKAQQRLTDLIRFAISFEDALINFLGVTGRGPIREEYIATMETDIRDKLKQLNTQKVTSVDSILTAYSVKGPRNPVITYKPDFSRHERVVPDAAFLKRHNPGYFALGATRVASMVIQDEDKDRPRFVGLRLTNEEVIMMAQLEKDEKRQTNFKELIAVLYHMLRNMDEPEHLEAHTAVFRRLISTVSQQPK